MDSPISQATKQVKRYRQHLQAKYHKLLRLRSYVVVALGFERLVWLDLSDKAPSHHTNTPTR